MFFKWKFLFIIAILWIRVKKISAQKSCPPLEAILPCRCLMRGEEYQIWCSHSDLPRVLDGLRAVGEYITDPIDELILENNFLPSLPGRTFFPLKILRLMLRYNGLERVSSDWLAGLQSSLVEIFIVEPQLRSLPDDSLSQLDAMQAVTIQTNLLKRLPLFSSLPMLRYLQIESESLVELSPVNFKNNPRLEKLHITSSPRLNRLEGNLLQDLPHLALVNISFCGINWVHPRAISRLPLLKELWLVGNKITDAGMIGRGSRDLPQLEIIKLDHNYIDKIGEAAFVDLPALKKIYLPNNRITELHHGAFHRVPLLRSLDLNRNMLRRVHPESFLQNSGSGLEELSLVENDISHVAELRSLLDALPRLVFLDMSYNNLEAIPFGALRGHPTLEHLNLDYNKIHLIDREAFMAMPALRELRLKNNSLSDILEWPLWNLPALKGLDLSGNFFKRLDHIFLANLPSLRRIDLSDNDLAVIDPSLFLPTPSLEHINVSFNDLTAVHPTAFRNLLNLYELDLSHNHLLQFVPGLPRSVENLHLHHNKISEITLASNLDLPFLRMLDLSHNQIQNIPNGSFRTLPQLRRLYLGRNLLQNLEENSLAGLSRLETLDLQENRLVQIHTNAFTETTELKEINLNNNRLDILIPDIFKNMPLLKRLDVSKNQLAEILPGTLEKNMEIQIIDASHNALVQLPAAFYGLKNLRHLDLTDNRIKNIDPNVIGSLMKLKELKLSNNFIQELKHGTFNYLQHLKTIHLDNNELEYIEPNSIKELPVLKHVKLNKNKIKEIPNSAFNKLPSLQVIELQENELTNIASEAFNVVPHLLMLNLSYNQLHGLGEAGLRSLRSLEMLDVSNNKISKVSGRTLERMEWLVELKIDNNDICGVQGSAFNGMPRLRVLSLKNNKLISFPESAVQRLRGNIAVLDIDGNPLECTCNMLWLQAWLQESSQIGPHCADGSLLREMLLSRQECREEERDIEVVAPGCEAELLSAPGVYSTSQVFSHHWMDLKTFKNVTRQVSGNKNNLAPSPEESDYFYDEYVDYPSYNESFVDPHGLPKEKLKDKEVVTETVTMKIPLTTKSSHYTAGDTPTIYAASKNKTKKPEIPPKVTNSPSTSGFTFFGVPLSNLNLNNLLGGGSGRLETKRPSTTIVADRKTAILNKNPTRSTGRGSMGNSMPSNLPLKMHPPPYMQPPSLPEIQTGFVPILPGYGGFKPIPNPHLPINTPTFANMKNIPPTENPIDAINVSPTSLSTIVHLPDNVNRQYPGTSYVQQNAPPNTFQRNQNIGTSTPPSIINKTNFSMSKNENQERSPPNPVNVTTKPIDVEKGEKFQAKIPLESGNKDANATEDFVETVSALVQEITTGTIEQTTLTPELDTWLNVEKSDSILTESSDDIQTVPIITTEESKIYSTINPNIAIGTAEAVPPNVTPEIIKNVHIGPKKVLIPNEGAPRTPSPALIVPGSHPQSQFKHGGRSTITKVPSPHIGPNVALQPNLDVPLDPLPHREGKNSHEYKMASTIDETSNDDTNWYFANYNKSNLEPYVARITNTNSAVRDSGIHPYLQLMLFIFYIKTISVFL